MLKRIQEMEFVAVELNLYLDTHPCDADALNDYNCAVRALQKLKLSYSQEFGPLANFGLDQNNGESWRWIECPWPWEI
jgi:spore coat protein JB